MTEPAQKPAPQSYERDQVVKIISSVMAKVEGAETEAQKAIFEELSNLRSIIQEARNELGSARPSDIKDKFIPSATDELDAVIEATAKATGDIMDSCDAIQENADKAGGEPGEAINNEVMKIYEACSFQDITGQRINKVVTTIKTIEERVDKLLATLGNKAPGMDQTSAAAAEAKESISKKQDKYEGYLNGPQLEGQGVGQDDIDKILAEFDNAE